jgi:hypothetical protein
LGVELEKQIEDLVGVEEIVGKHVHEMHDEAVAEFLGEALSFEFL